MLRLRYRTALLLGIALLSVGGLAGYLIFHNKPAAVAPQPESAATPPVESPTKSDPALAHPRSTIVSVVAAFPGASPEEVERQVAIPLEVNLAGMPRLESLRNKSLFGVCWLHACFQPGTPYADARREVIDRLATMTPLPPGVVPQIAPGPGRHSLRYVLTGPRDAKGQPIYTLQELRSLQDWVLEREWRRVPGVVDVVGSGGTVKRYEIHLDYDRMRQKGITLNQIQNAVSNANANVGGDYLLQGSVALNVRSVGLIGGGEDPLHLALGMTDPAEAVRTLRAAEQRRIREIRQLVITSNNNVAILVEDVVEGGRVAREDLLGQQGVVIGGEPRVERVLSEGADAVGGVVLLRPDEEPQLLRGAQDRIRELNATAGRLLPGVRIEPYFASTDGGENNLWVYGTLPMNVSLEGATEIAQKVRELLHQTPEVERVVSQLGGSVYGTSTQSFSQVLFYVGLKGGEPGKGHRPRSRPEQIEEVKSRLSQVPGAEWLTTTNDPLELERTFPDTPAEHLLMITGPDLQELERLAGRIKNHLREVPGVESVGVFHSAGQSRLEFRVDPEKCKKWGVRMADVNALIQTALAGKMISQMVEGERIFDITLRSPQRLRSNETAILDLPVDIENQNLSVVPTPPGSGVVPSSKGTQTDPSNPISNTPRLRLRDLVSPLGKDGEADPAGSFARAGSAVIYRKDGKRVLPIRFSVSGRSLADIQAEGGKKIKPLLQEPYRIEWSPRE